MIIVSTDGSCLGSPGGAIGWAWVDHDGGRFDSGGAATGTDQVAELTALLRAIEAHAGAEPLLVESGSQYAIRCASEWVAGWKSKGWRTASGDPVKNLELVQSIDQAVTDREGPVRFHWVRGHVGNPFNERAAQLAGLAAQEWAAGRGEVDGLLVGDLAASPAPGQVKGGAAQAPAVPATTTAWESATLFD